MGISGRGFKVVDDSKDKTNVIKSSKQQAETEN